MSEEDINNLKEMLVDFNEYSTDYTKTRCKELEKTIENTLKEVERLKKQLNDEIDDELKQSEIMVKKQEEIKRLKEEYVMLQNASDEVEEEKDREIGRLTAESTKWESKFYDEAKKVDKAIEYIEKRKKLNWYADGVFVYELLNILQGSDKE